MYDGFISGSIDGRADISPFDVEYLAPGLPGYDPGYLTTLHQRRARAIIDAHDLAHPLFLYMAFAAVHSPLQATDLLEGRVAAARGASYFSNCSWFDWGELWNPTPVNFVSPDPTVQTAGSAYSTCIAAERTTLEAMGVGVDDAIGEAMRALVRRGMWREALIVTISDNGGAPSLLEVSMPINSHTVRRETQVLVVLQYMHSALVCTPVCPYLPVSGLARRPRVSRLQQAPARR